MLPGLKPSEIEMYSKGCYKEYFNMLPDFYIIQTTSSIQATFIKSFFYKPFCTVIWCPELLYLVSSVRMLFCISLMWGSVVLNIVFYCS